MDCTNSQAKFIEVEKRIRALTTILNNVNYHVAPSSDPKDVPTFLCHFANLLTTDVDKKCHEAKRVVAVTGSLLPDGTTSTLVVTQNHFPEWLVEKLYIEDVSKSRKSFDEIVDLNRFEYMLNTSLNQC
jgi:hypothetical protein